VAETPTSNTEPTAESTRTPGWRRARPWAVGVGILVLLAILLVIPNPWGANRAVRALTELGFSKGTCSDGNGTATTPESECLAWRAKPGLSTAELGAEFDFMFLV